MFKNSYHEQKLLTLLTKKQTRDLSDEFSGLKNSVKDQIDELKFDLDNSKPTEIRTEENSKRSLEFSKQVVPLIERSNNVLDKVDNSQKKVESRLS